jgi:hypothetical protein
MRSRSVRLLLPCFLLVLGLLPAAAGRAASIVLSTHSSEDPGYPPASVLDATLDFSVAGTTLTLTVTNDTSAPDEFDILELFFNGSSNVTSVTLTSVDGNPCPGVLCGWAFSGPAAADGFGVFDFHLVDGLGTDPDQITPGETVTFVFAVNAGLADSDFTTVLSIIPPGETPALAAAKFVNGPGDASGFGATVPEPGTLALLAAGLAALAASPRARRRASR